MATTMVSPTALAMPRITETRIPDDAAGTTTLNDSSYYLSSTPSFWNISSSFPSVGEPVVFGSGSIPARDRFISGTNLTACNESVVTGIIFNEGLNDISVYPNPAHSFLDISVLLSEKENMQIFLSDVLGNKISEKKITAAEHLWRLNLPGNIKPGIYLLTLRSDKRIVTKKIILN